MFYFRKVSVNPDFISFFGAVAVIFLGLWVLMVGLLLKADLKAFLVPGNLPMAWDAAVGFILAGGAIALHLYRQEFPAVILTFLLAGLSGFSLLQLCGVVTIAYSEAYFWIQTGMSPQTALCFLFISIFFLMFLCQRYIRFAQYILHTVTLVSFVVLLGHLLGICEFYYLTFLKAMAIYTAAGLFFLSVTVSFLCPSLGLTGLFRGKRMANVVARRTFFQLFIAIIVIGYLRVVVHRYTDISAELATGLSLVVCILFFLFVVKKTAHVINALEKKERQARKNLKLVFDSAPYALVVSDKSGNIIIANDYAERLYGYSKAMLRRLNVEQIIPKENRGDYRRKMLDFFIDPAVKSYSFEDHFFGLRNDGTKFPIELVITPLRTKSKWLVLSCITDVSLRRQQQELIQEHLIELQFRNKELQQLTAMVSHDLQEPLRTISNYSALLEEDFCDELSNEAMAQVCAIKAVALRMRTMVSHLLNYSKLGTNRELTLTDFTEVIETLKNDLSALLSDRSATITVTGVLPVMYAYETEVRQLFQNLIHNAVKFAKKDTPPEITIDCKELKGVYEFSFADSGIGIPSAERHRVFNIFHKASNAGLSNYQGSGVGLACVKKIVEMHGGKIWIEDSETGGSVFRFTIIKLK